MLFRKIPESQDGIFRTGSDNIGDKRRREEKEMYSRELIELYMKQKNYTQQKQVAADLKISKTYISQIWNDEHQLTDEMGIFLAIECELDPAEVVLKLAAARAKTPQAKNVWIDAVKRYCTGSKAASCAGLTLLAAHFPFRIMYIMLN